MQPLLSASEAQSSCTSLLEALSTRKSNLIGRETLRPSWTQFTGNCTYAKPQKMALTPYLGGLWRQVDGLLECGARVVDGPRGGVHKAEGVGLGQGDQVGGREGAHEQQQQLHVQLVAQRRHPAARREQGPDEETQLGPQLRTYHWVSEEGDVWLRSYGRIKDASVMVQAAADLLPETCKGMEPDPVIRARSSH